MVVDCYITHSGVLVVYELHIGNFVVEKYLADIFSNWILLCVCVRTCVCVCYKSLFIFQITKSCNQKSQDEFV